MKSLTVLCVLAVVCSAFGAPDVESHDLLEGPNHDINMISHTRELLEVLVGNLHKAAQDALNSVNSFNTGMKDEAEQIREKIISDVQIFRNRVTEAIENVIHRISGTNVAVKDCVDSHRSAAAVVFNETLSSTLACVDERIGNISEVIHSLVTLANDAIAGGSQAVEDMKKCTDDHGNILSTGSCLGAIMMRTQMKSVGFIVQSTVIIGRINVGIASLPAALEMCAGMHLIQTGIQTGKIIVKVGTCSATGIFNTIIGKPYE